MTIEASLRSGDLARQVGASILDANGDLLAVGYNEVPKPGGGPYGPGPHSHRDLDKGSDSNDQAKEEMLIKILNALNLSDLPLTEAKAKLKPTGFMDLT